MASSKNPYHGNIDLEGWSPPPAAAMAAQQQQYPAQQHEQQIVIVSQPQTLQYAPVGPKASRMTCPSCRADIKTRVKHKATSNTHCWACCLCCFLCWPCVCLPYCMDSCQNANHYCPNCNAFIGTYQS